MEPSAACGLKVGVAQGGLQESKEVPAKSDECVAAGLSPIDMVVFTRQDDLTKALVAGEVDAMSADSPVTGFAVKLSAGVLETAGEVTRRRAVRLAGGQGVRAGGVAEAGVGATDEDGRVSDHRDAVGGLRRVDRHPPGGQRGGLEQAQTPPSGS